MMMESCNKNKPFDGYLYPIRENGLYGFIDSVGNRIIEPEFLWVSTFHNGLAMAVVDTIYRIVPDSMAYEVGERDTIINVYRMYARYGYINKSREFAIEPKFVSYVNMNEIGDVTNDIDDCSNALYRHSFRNGRAMFCDTITWKDGYIDTKGNIAIEAKYYYSEPFSEGLAVVWDAVGEPLYTNKVCIDTSKLRCAYLDTLGNAVTEFEYESLTRFGSGRGIGNYRRIIKDTVAIKEDTAFIYESSSRYHFLLDRNGKVIKELKGNQDYYGYSRDGICVTSDNYLWRLFVGTEKKSFSFIGEDGDFLEPLKGLSEYQIDSLDKCNDIIEVLPDNATISDATYYSDGLAGISPDGKHWFVIDKYLIIHGYGEESIFDGFRAFNNGLAAVKKNGKWGFINREIKVQIPCKYDSCGAVYPYLEEVFEYDIQGEVKKKAYINRKDSLVWESPLYKSEMIDNRYSIKESKDYGKWTYEYNPLNKHLLYLIIITVIVLLITICVIWNSVSSRSSKGKKLEELVIQNEPENEVVVDIKLSNVNDDDIDEILTYPTVGQYTETIRESAKAPDEYFDKLKHLRPVLDGNGDPIMSGGNFAVVFKMKDEYGKQYAVKCFHRAQQGRENNYKLICEELAKVSSPYLSPIRYYDKELFVESDEYPVLLMDWVEGMTLDKYIRKVINDKKALSQLVTNFKNLAIWLLNQPFAHGDIKPDNILVKNDGSLVLVDYDGMFVPAMQGQKAREIGSPDFRNPSRTEDDFNKDIDNFPIISILLSLELLIENKEYLSKFGAEDRLLFSEENYRNLEDCKMFQIASKSLRNNTIDLVKLLREELSGIKHLPSEIVFIISGEKREKDYHANDKIDLFANILFGLYCIFILAFPLVAFNILEWRVITIASLMLGSNVIAYLLFNIIDSCRPNKEYHILNESTIGCLGTPASIIPIFFMASSSYEEEWYITALIWIISWLSLMSYFGISSLKDEGISKFFTKKKENIYWNDIIEGLQMALFLAPAFGFPILIVMIMDKGWDSFFVWLKYVAIVDTIGLFGVIISLIYKRLGK
jgi:hypothetical protein